MQEKNKRYSCPRSGYSSRVIPSESGSDNRTNSLPCQSLQSLYSANHPKSSPPSLSRTGEAVGKFDLKMTRSSISSPASPKNFEFERLDRRRCLSTPRYSTWLDTSTSSQCLPKRKAMFSTQDVKLHGYTSLGQMSNGGLSSTVSSIKPLYGKQIPPQISEYWELRRPDSFRPFRDRTSPDWDPDEEYQALLDFTYPLRPGHFASKNSLDGDDLSSDSCLKDSGIVADSPLPSLSNTLTTNSTFPFPASQSSTSNTANLAWGYSSRREDMDPPRYSSSPLHMCRQPSNLTSHPTYKASIIPRAFVECSPINKMQLPESLTNRAIPSDSTLTTSVANSRFLLRSLNEESSNHLRSGSDPVGFIPTTQILPLNKEWENDEEYLALPYKLNELEVLAQQLENFSVHLDNKSTYMINAKGGIIKTTEGTDIQGGSTEDSLIDQSSSAEVAQSSCQLGISPINAPKGPWREDTIMDLKKTSDFIKKLGRWPGSRLILSQQLEQVTEEQKNDSLLVHMQTFSTKLEEMVEWLYEVVETTDNWIPPQFRMESIKASLDKCMAFKQLTESVLTSGEILLKAMTNTTPVLKETLELIARQSKQLNGHAAHLYSSVLAAMNMVKDDLETKQQEFKTASLERQSVLTLETASGFAEHDASNHMNLDHSI
ncbi:centrosomal protein of 68 kDa [Heterodontus francisci]|uniref:centrosomal protein of 68 kDa n=1 Tax=Heterodontus francisci TaxID=7792 RepID=UPI00355AEBCE